ncbi:TrmH family RNA methyltransferase [Undibacterium rugosum]|uniref:RNA methyltransferase n=1 Tax=Undibacterium rugosum TaxID=2762291 RepID=A0A923I065_9BURK|nr:RNA methyltransferase [Undibacterium rugosum]MBC3935384.1 RNA methyltransferase [Undibacterium rugosum]MBR7778841.1 RNA methyltransferase [Undibacterium rugosum]
MKHITSRDNPLFKELRQLATQAQARRKAGRTLLDGVHLCQAYSQQLGAPEICVVSESALANTEVNQLVSASLLDAAQKICLPDALYETLSQVEHGVGILFVVPTPARAVPAALTETAVVLDGLQDPGNLGSILRSAAAAGIRHVFCSNGTVSAWSPKVMRAGMGAHFLLHIYENCDLVEVLNRSKIPVLATSSHTKTTIYQSTLNQPVVWMFGHEGQGVSAALMAKATQTVTIPQQAAIESLNVAASAAICFFEQVRQQLT